MKKPVITLLLVAVSWALSGVPAQAATANSPTMKLAKQHHHKKHHSKHKKHAKA